MTLRSAIQIELSGSLVELLTGSGGRFQSSLAAKTLAQSRVYFHVEVSAAHSRAHNCTSNLTFLTADYSSQIACYRNHQKLNQKEIVVR